MDWLRFPIGATVIIQFGAEQIITKLQTIDAVIGGDVTNMMIGQYKGWLVYATASALDVTSAEGEPLRLLAGGHIEVRLTTPSSPTPARTYLRS